MYRRHCIIISLLSLFFTANASSIVSIANQDSWFDSLNVRFVGNWPFGRLARGVATDSNRDLMFLGSSGGVYILDITDPQLPVKISEQIHTRGIVEDLCYMESSQRLYIADGQAGLEIWDISNPGSPNKLGFCDTPNYAHGIYVQDIFTFVADFRSLRIIDVSTPTNPREIGYCDITGYPLNVYVLGSYAYIATAFYGGLVIVDISSPTNPQVVGSFGTTETFHDVYVSGTYAYVSNPGEEDSVSLLVIDISDPTNPFEVSRLMLGEGIYGDCELSICDSFAYFSQEPFQIINIADPYNPYMVGVCSESGNSVHISGNHAYVASYPGLIIDISIPSDPHVVGCYDIPYSVNDVHVSVPYAYLVDSHKGLYIIDITSPTNPFEVGKCQINGSAESIFKIGDNAYIPYKISSYDSMHLAVIDVTDPSNPQHIGNCQADYPNRGGAHGIYVLGQYAYITIRNYWTGGQGGLWIVDVSDPSNPQGVGYFEDPQEDHKSFGVYVVDTLAYLAATDFYIINVSDPSNPHQLGYCPTLCEAYDVHVVGSYAYVTDGWAGSNVGLRVIDVSNPTDPQMIGSCYVNYVKAISIFSNYAFIATGEGLKVIDVSLPSNPQEVGYYTATSTNGIYAVNSLVYMTSLGLQIYENLLPGIEEMTTNNHFGATIFSGHLQLPEDKNCRVFDITGRVVLPQYIKPGVYFIEIDGKVTGKVIKIK